MPIVATESIEEFFSEIVESSMRARGVSATEVATNYVVSLLKEFARPDERVETTFSRPLTFLLDEALHTSNLGERFERLRLLGDGVLYTTGFFGDHLEARGVDPQYVISIGTTAYENASSLLHGGALAVKERDGVVTKRDIFRELASKFVVFVQVINDVADTAIAGGASSAGDASAKNLLTLYERWLKTGSDTLAQTLSSHGLVPTRGGKGVLQ